MDNHRELLRFNEACARRFGPDRVECNADGAMILVHEVMVHVRPAGSGRVAFWTDLDRPQGAPMPLVENVAMIYTAETYLQSGFVLAAHRDVGLVVLGCSLDAEILRHESAFGLIERLAREAPAARARIDAALSEPFVRSKLHRLPQGRGLSSKRRVEPCRAPILDS